MAEVARGGLQALPKGQYEAAKSLEWILETNALIILPQALKLVIPGSKYSSSFSKRYTINFRRRVDGISWYDRFSKTNPKWLGMAMEGYVLRV